MKKESSEFKELTEYFSSLGPPAIKTLLDSLEDEKSRHVRLLTCQSLARMGDLAVGVVAERLDHEQWFVVRNAASILGQIGVADCVPHLQKALSHAEPRVKREALKGLASMKTEEAIDLICECVQEHDIDICKAALGWVAILRSSRAMPALQGLLGNGFMWKADDEVVRLAIQALGAIEGEEPAEMLENLSETRKLLFGRKKAAFIRAVAIAALSKRKKGR
jgi:HEAT repeat protein